MNKKEWIGQHAIDSILLIPHPSSLIPHPLFHPSSLCPSAQFKPSGTDLLLASTQFQIVTDSIYIKSELTPFSTQLLPLLLLSCARPRPQRAGLIGESIFFRIEMLRKLIRGEWLFPAISLTKHGVGRNI